MIAIVSAKLMNVALSQPLPLCHLASPLIPLAVLSIILVTRSV